MKGKAEQKRRFIAALTAVDHLSARDRREARVEAKAMRWTVRRANAARAEAAYYHARAFAVLELQARLDGTSDASKAHATLTAAVADLIDAMSMMMAEPAMSCGERRERLALIKSYRPPSIRAGIERLWDAHAEEWRCSLEVLA